MQEDITQEEIAWAKQRMLDNLKRVKNEQFAEEFGADLSLNNRHERRKLAKLLKSKKNVTSA